MKRVPWVFALAVIVGGIAIAQVDPFGSRTSPAVVKMDPGFHIAKSVLAEHRVMALLVKRHAIPDGGLTSGDVVELAQREFSAAKINHTTVGEPKASQERKSISSHGD